LGVPKLEVPKVHRLSGPKGLVTKKQSLEVHKGRGPKDWRPPWFRGPHGLGAPMGWGHPRVAGPPWILGRVYETKPIIAVLFSLVWFCFVQRMQS
jgi:hypothetical protein